MKPLNNKIRINSPRLISLLVFFTSILFILFVNISAPAKIIAKERQQNKPFTLHNDKYGFEITFPQSWTYMKGLQPDPDEGMRTGEASFSISTGISEEELQNWNAFVITSTDSSENAQPYISVSAHKKPNQSLEEFASLLESTIEGYGGKVLSMNKIFSVGDANGFDCNYNLFVHCRYAALYKNGIRVIVHYFFPASDTTLFDKHSADADLIINSLRIR